jgi:hypothetical protein
MDQLDTRQLIDDASRPVNLRNRSFLAWMTLLTLALMACLYAYSLQLRKGLGVTGLGDYISLPTLFFLLPPA